MKVEEGQSVVGVVEKDVSWALRQVETKFVLIVTLNNVARDSKMARNSFEVKFE